MTKRFGRLDKIARSLAQDERWNKEDVKYIHLVARLLRLTTGTHGRNGNGKPNDDRCPACHMAIELEDMENEQSK